MATKIRNVELLTLARSDAGIPVLGHVGVGIDANLIQDFEMALSRVSEADQFHLALNTEGTITDSGSGGIAFTHGSSAETVLASIKLLHKATGYPDLSFNTLNVSDALLIKADGSVSTNGRLDVNSETVKLYNSVNTNNTFFFAENTSTGNAGIKLKNSQGEFTIIANDRLRFISDDSPSVEVMSLHPNGKVGIGTGSSAPTARLEVVGDLFVHENGSGTNRLKVSYNGTNGNAIIGADSSSGDTELQFGTSNSGTYASHLFLTKDGNAGLGTSSPGSVFWTSTRNLHISDATAAGLFITNTTNSLEFNLACDSGGGVYFDVHDSTDGNDNFFAFRTEDTGGANTPTERLRIDKDGKLLLGASTQSLSWPATTAQSTSRAWAFIGEQGAYGKFELRRSSSATTSATDGTSISTMAFDRDGNVGIGTGSSAFTSNLTVQASDQADLLIGSTGGARALLILDGSANGDGLGGDYAYLAHETDGRLTIANSHAGNVITLDGNVGIGTGSSNPSQILEIKSSSQTKLLINRDAANDAELEFKNTEQSWTTGIDRSNSNTFTIAAGTSLGNTTGLRLTTAGRVGIGTGVSGLTELLEVNGNVKATKFIGALEGTLEGTLETARNIVVGKSSAGAGDIDAITQSFDGGANISFDSELNSHLPSNLRGTTSSNIADEPSNNAVKIIGSDINTPRLKINRQGLIVGFEEVATTGGSGSGGISALTLNTYGLLYLNSNFTSQTETTSTSTPALNLYLNAAGLFTAASMSFDNGGAYQSVLSLTVGGTTKTVDLDYDGLFTDLSETTGTMSMTIGGTTKTLTLPDASFTQLDLSGSTLRATVGSTQRTVGLSSISVANATNATNADNIAINTTSTTGTRYITFTTNTSGDRQIFADTGLTFQPSSNTLTATTFSGALSGNATTSSGLLVGSTVYVPSSDADFAESLVLRNSSNEVSIAKLILSDNTTTANIDVIVGKISNSDLLREFSVGQVRTFIDPDNTRFLPSPTDGVYPLTVSNATSAGSATTAGSAGSISAGVGGQAFSAVTANGFVKLSDSNGTLSVGALESGDIPNNAANTTGKANTAGTADVADTVTFGSLDISASHANTESTLVVRGADKSINIGALSSTDITAQSLVLDNEDSALEVQEIIPRGGSMLNWGENGSNWPGGLTPGFETLPNWYVRDESQLGDGTSNTKGAFKAAHFGEVFSWDGYFTASDARVKNDIQTFSLGLDFVRLIEPKQFTWSKSTTPRIKYGALAQEMEEAVSQLVDEETSFINIQNYHENSDEENEQALKTIENNQVMWVLFNAVKQLDAKVQELEKQLDKS